jgi:hypothetical protein
MWSARLPNSMDDHDLNTEHNVPPGRIKAIKFDVLTGEDIVSIFLILCLFISAS